MEASMLVQTNMKHLPLPASSVDLIFTDPPYLRKYLDCYRWLADEAARVLKPGGFVLAICGGLYLNHIFRFFDDAGLNFFWKYETFMAGKELSRVWPKGNPDISIRVNSKPILAYSKGAVLPPTSTLNMIRGGGRDKRFHHWGQDVATARYFVAKFSQPNSLVVDPFIGGGTTAVACEQLERRWLGGDLDPKALSISATRLHYK
jgi:DNA modification methylase